MISVNKEVVNVFNDHLDEIKSVVTNRPQWEHAGSRFDQFFLKLADDEDSLWSEYMLNLLTQKYFEARDSDDCSKNITLRTVKAMPPGLKNDTKKIFLEIAEVCQIFHAGHKVNFEAEELPEGYENIKIVPSKKKGYYCIAEPFPSLYRKISLTFDYWVPKILEWTEEIRKKNFTEWRGELIFQHESCTDFMRIALLFLSSPEKNLPIAKSDLREIILKRFFNEDFLWIKKSKKREDILTNNTKLSDGLRKLSDEVDLAIPFEAWSRILNLKYIKMLLK